MVSNLLWLLDKVCQLYLLCIWKIVWSGTKYCLLCCFLLLVYFHWLLISIGWLWLPNKWLGLFRGCWALILDLIMRLEKKFRKEKMRTYQTMSLLIIKWIGMLINIIQENLLAVKLNRGEMIRLIELNLIMIMRNWVFWILVQLVGVIIGLKPLIRPIYLLQGKSLDLSAVTVMKVCVCSDLIQKFENSF